MQRLSYVSEIKFDASELTRELFDTRFKRHIFSNVVVTVVPQPGVIA